MACEADDPFSAESRARLGSAHAPPRRRRRPAARLVPARDRGLVGRGRVWSPAIPTPDVRRVLLAVDPAPPVAAEAAAWDADLLLVHHPLFLRGVHGVAETTPKGRTLGDPDPGRLRPADRAHQRRPGSPGVSEALARALGLRDVAARSRRAVRRSTSSWCSRPSATPTRSAMLWPRPAPGRIGDYDTRRSPAWRARAGSGRSPAPTPRSARVGELEVVDEVRIEARAAARHAGPTWSGRARGAPLRGVGVRRRRARRPRRRRRPAPAGSATSTRPRWGRSPRPWPRRCPRRRGASASAATPTASYDGWRCAGAPATSCSTRALTSDADVYVTSDLRHHPAGRVPGAGRAVAARRLALGGRVDLAPGAGGAARRGTGRYGGDPGEHALHRRVAGPPMTTPRTEPHKEPAESRSRPPR